MQAFFIELSSDPHSTAKRRWHCDQFFTLVHSGAVNDQVGGVGGSVQLWNGSAFAKQIIILPTANRCNKIYFIMNVLRSTILFAIVFTFASAALDSGYPGSTMTERITTSTSTKAPKSEDNDSRPSGKKSTKRHTRRLALKKTKKRSKSKGTESKSTKAPNEESKAPKFFKESKHSKKNSTWMPRMLKSNKDADKESDKETKAPKAN